MLNKTPLTTDIFSIDQLYDSYALTENMINNLDAASLRELYSGSGNDIDVLLDTCVREFLDTLNARKISYSDYSRGYLDSFSKCVEESFRKVSFAYFIISVLKDFTFNWHHYEWSIIPQLFKKFSVLACRDGGKSHQFSFAFPIWKMYRYTLPHEDGYRPEYSYSKEGMIVTSERSLAEYLLTKVKDEIEDNEILNQKLFPKSGDVKTKRWGAGGIKCKNDSSIFVKSYGSKMRGRHPHWIIADDFLSDQVLYSKTQREKYINFFSSVIENMVIPGGSVGVVGCVALDTIVMTDNGIKRMQDISPTNDFSTKNIFEFNKDVVNGFGEYETASHYYVNGNCDTKIIETNLGYELECSLIHPIQTLRQDGSIAWVKSSEIKEGDYIAIKGYVMPENIGEKVSTKPFNEMQDLVQSKQYQFRRMDVPEYIDEDLAYMIGLWVAEGSYVEHAGTSSSYYVEIANPEQPIIDFLLNNKWGLNFRNRASSGKLWANICTSKALLMFIRDFLGLKSKKSVYKRLPEKLIRAEKKIIRAMLQGLFDGDGSSDLVEPMIQLSNTSYELLQQTQTLLLMCFDVRANLTRFKKGSISKYESGHPEGELPCYSLRIGGYEASKFLQRVGFRLERKQNRHYIDLEDSYENQIIPNQKELLLRLKDTVKIQGSDKPMLGVKSISSFNISVNKTGHSRKKIAQFAESCSKRGCDENILKEVLDVLSYDVYWDKVNEIRDGKAETVDFVLPKTHSFITNGIVSHNTPFHSADLYGHIKKQGVYRCFEYPAIFPDGRLLWEGRHSMEGLLEKAKSQGSVIFSREVLVRPVSNESSVFPMNILKRSIVGMDSYTLVNNIYSHPIRSIFNRVVMGCDFAISASASADYSAFGMLGVSSVDGVEHYYLLNVWHEKGKSYGEQQRKIKQLHTDFNFDLGVLESVQMQQIFVEGAAEMGLPVEGHHTSAKTKYDLKEGLPSLAILFEQGRIHFPYGDEHSRGVVDMIFEQLQSMSWSDHGIESTSEHDDLVMMLLMCIIAARKCSGFLFDFG